MTKLFKNGKVVNVFTAKIEEADILIKDDKIVGLGNRHEYDDYPVDEVIDVTGMHIAPGFIDGHLHIESTMLNPYEFSKAAVLHGTTAIVSDPHEIANVCGVDGIKYMLEASNGLPVDIFMMIPSCVPATSFDESLEEIDAKSIESLFSLSDKILGLAEVMNYVGVVHDDKTVLDKIEVAHKLNKLIDGHAPCLSGKDLDKYLSYNIRTDHECTSYNEAIEKIRKGQWVMIRRGTASKNLHDMLDLFDGPERSRCLLVSDDKEPADLLYRGHIDSIINKAVRNGKSVITGIQMATINAATCFKLEGYGAIAPGYFANIVILDDLPSVHIKDVYKNGKAVVFNGHVLDIKKPTISDELISKIKSSMNCSKIKKEDLYIKPEGNKVNVIGAQSFYLITTKLQLELDFSNNNGIDVNKDILKIAVVERHKNTGHIGLGYIQGIGLKEGAIASTVSHDSHNIICIGTNDEDMVCAINHIIDIGGGNVVVNNSKVIKETQLPIAGLMSDKSVEEMAYICDDTRTYVHKLGVPKNIDPFMNMAFVSLPVIPSLKLTTLGLVDVDEFKLIPLFIK